MLCLLDNIKKTVNYSPPHKYSVLNSETLTQPIQMQLSKKQKNFLELFCAFLKSRLKFEHFEEKNDPHRVCISETTEYKKCD